MSKRQKTISEEKSGSRVDEVQEPPPETRRTRSGRKVRTPAALLESEAPVRTPARRTRKSVLQELQVQEEKNTQATVPKPESLTEEKPSIPAEAEPCVGVEPAELLAEAAADSQKAGDDGTAHVAGPTPAKTAPTSDETVPKKKPRLGSTVKQNPAIPLGKPKSGRVWKNRNKQR